jgi:hypothetical protein
VPVRIVSTDGPIQVDPGEPPAIYRVRVVDFDISFGNLVFLLVKVALAAVPALLILLLLGAIIVGMVPGKL